MSRSTPRPSRTFRSAAAAFKRLERRFGPPEHEFLYTDADDEPVGVVFLWEEGDDDRRVTIARWKNRWVIGDMSPPRPLYQWPSLAAAARVYCVATELEAERLRDLGLTATCYAASRPLVEADGAPASAKGEPPVAVDETDEPPVSTLATDVDWRPLAGKEVILLPCASDDGEAWAEAICQCLASPGSELKCAVHVLRLPGLGPQAGVIDWLGHEFGIERLQAGVENIDADELAEYLEATGQMINALADVEAGGSPASGSARVADPADAMTDGRQSDDEDQGEEEKSHDDATYDPPVFTHGAVVHSAGGFDSTEIQWLWPGRIALGKLTLLAGDPGVGKSLLTLNIAARVTAGWGWPDAPVRRGSLDPADATTEGLPSVAESGDLRSEDGRGQRPAPNTVTTGDVILLSAEDDPQDTICPRLQAAGAYMERAHILTHVLRSPDADGRRQAFRLSVGHDIRALTEVILSRKHCRLVIIDPITAFLGGADQHRHSHVLRLLDRLAELARVTGVAVLAVTHLNKRTDSPAIHRAMGSLAFTAVARSVWLVTKDASDPDGARRQLSAVKNNLGSDQNSLAFSIICPPPCTQPLIEWHRATLAADADTALGRGAADPSKQPVLDEALHWLQQLLSAGPRPAGEVKKQARTDGIRVKSLYTAKSLLGVDSHRESQGNAGEGRWVWELPQA